MPAIKKQKRRDVSVTPKTVRASINGANKGVVSSKISKNEFKAESSKFLELPLAELEAQLVDQIDMHLMEQPVWLENVSDPGVSNEEYYDDSDDYDLLDPPDIEENIETGEGEQDDPIDVIDVAENFLDYTWGRFFLDYGHDDADLQHIVRQYLENWEYPYYPLEQFLRLRKEHRVLLPWFTSLREEYGATIDESMTDQYHSDIPDLIFTVNNNEVSYEINLGMLERLSMPEDASGMMLKISEKGAGFPLSLLNQMINKRRTSLALLAEYLLAEQKEFILAPSLAVGVAKLKLIQQTDFKFYLKEMGITKTIDEVGRILKGKHIKIPFCSMALPARICFAPPVQNVKKLSDAERVLDEAFKIHHGSNSGVPLNAPDQAAIISAVLGIKYPASNVHRTLWVRMRERYPVELWPKLRIIGKDERGNDIKNVGNKISAQELERLCIAVKAALRNSLLSKSE